MTNHAPPVERDPIPYRPVHSLEGRELGNYRVVSRIGQGGMGDIYLAEHTRLGGQVAIKVLRPDLTMRHDVVERFFNEARAVNQIGNPNIVNIIDFVENYDCSPPLVYMVMEYLKGWDLSLRLRQDGCLAPAEAVAMTIQVCRALQSVHAERIIHRDLKPDNIFLVDSGDDEPRIKLLDFGVARAFGDQRARQVTDPGTTIGTPEYMAPEQVVAGDLDARTDIYSLGVVMYEMLSGRVPFSARSIGEIFVKTLNDVPPPLSAASGGTAPVDIRLEALILRCLLKKPEMRFQSAGELIQALEDYLQDVRAPRDYPSGGIEAFRPTLSEPVEMDELSRREPNWKLVLVLLLVTVGVVVGLTVRFLRAQSEQPPAAAATQGPMPGLPGAVIPKPDAAAAPAALPPDLASAALDAGPPAKAADPAAVNEPREVAPRRPARPKKRRPPRKPAKQVDVNHGTLDPFAE